MLTRTSARLPCEARASFRMMSGSQNAQLSSLIDLVGAGSSLGGQQRGSGSARGRKEFPKKSWTSIGQVPKGDSKVDVQTRRGGREP